MLLAHARQAASEDLPPLRLVQVERPCPERDPLQVLRMRMEARIPFRSLPRLRAYDIRGSRFLAPPLQPLRSRMASPHGRKAASLPSVQEHEMGLPPSRPLHMPLLREGVDRRGGASPQVPVMQEHDVGPPSDPRPMQGLRALVDAQRRTHHRGRHQMSEVQVRPLDGAPRHREMPGLRTELCRPSERTRMPPVQRPTGCQG